MNQKYIERNGDIHFMLPLFLHGPSLRNFRKISLVSVYVSDCKQITIIRSCLWISRRFSQI